MPSPDTADPRYNMTDPVVLSPNEVRALAHSAEWLVQAMAPENWVRSRQGMSVEVYGAVISYNARTGVYTLVAHPFHQIWIELGRQQKGRVEDAAFH